MLAIFRIRFIQKWFGYFKAFIKKNKKYLTYDLKLTLDKG